MYLGQTATFLAQVFNRPEPTLQMLARLLRDSPEPWVKKGGRGRSAHHLDSREVAHFIIAMMSCPDSPAQAVARLPHFASLRLDEEGEQTRSFVEGVDLMLTRLASGDWIAAKKKNWSVTIAIDLSSASISEKVAVMGEDQVIEHLFFPASFEDIYQPIENTRPYRSGLSTTVKIEAVTLFRIAKVVIMNEADPLDEIIQVELGGKA